MFSELYMHFDQMHIISQNAYQFANVSLASFLSCCISPLSIVRFWFLVCVYFTKHSEVIRSML